MAGTHRARRRMPLYLIPIMIGLGGILFAGQLSNTVLQTFVIILSVSAPVFAGGNLLARIHGGGFQRAALIVGVLMLILGAMVTVAGLSGQIDSTDVPEEALQISLWIGLVSLLLGLGVVLFAVLHREEEVHELAERFRRLAEQMGDGFVLSDNEGRITVVNDRFLDMTGLSRGETVGTNIRDLAKGLALEPIMPHFDRRQKGMASEYHLSFQVAGEERHFWVNGTPIFDRRGNYAGALATFRDVTEQRRLSDRLQRYTEGLEQLVKERTEKLHDSEKRLRDLLVHMNEGFLTVDKSFRVRFANERICALLRQSAHELRDRSFFDFVEPACQGRLKRLFDLTGSQGTPVQQELDLTRPEGAPLPVVVAVAPISGVPEDGARYSLVVTDVREQRHMQQQLEIRARELELANEELRMMDRAKDGFLTNVSHELRTPLSTVKGYVEMFESEALGPVAESQRPAFGIMSRNLDRLSTLIDEMIEFSRMEIRGITVGHSLFSARAVIDECVESFRPLLLANNLSLGVDAPAEMPAVWGDRKRLAQVLAIFLSNAIKFTNEGGSIQVRAEAREGGTAALSVSDTGIGIAPALQKRVFDKFFQVDSSLARRYEGAGIGLSIALSIARAHNGTITLVSEPGKGSTFTLVLPGAVFNADLGPGCEGALKDLKVVLASSDSEFRRVLSDGLERSGCETLSVDNGYEAVRLAAERQPDVVLLDEELHKVGGLSAAVMLHEGMATSGIPTVVLSDGQALANPDKGGMPGIGCVLNKPFSLSQLVEAAGRALRRDHAVPAGQAASLYHRLPVAEADRRVVVIDADGDFLDWVECGLRHRHIDCQCADSIEAALDTLNTAPPEAIFVDADLSPVEGILSELGGAEGARGVRVYLMTGAPGDAAHNTGVAGVLRKPFAINQMAELVHRNGNGGAEDS